MIVDLHHAKRPALPEAKRYDATDLEVTRQTHHRSAGSIVGYLREADLFRNTSAKRLER